MALKISYSSATRFKECPTKYYLAKQYRNAKIASPLVFGSAIEEGVTEIITSRDLARGINVFHRNWLNERSEASKPIKDNPKVEYNDSDMETSLIPSAMGQEILKEYLDDTDANWEDALEICQKLMKAENANEQEAAFVNRLFWESCFARGKLMLTAFSEQLLPKVLSIVEIKGEKGVQFPIKLEDPNGNVIEGFIDYVLRLKDHARPVIIDCKTAAMPYDNHKLVSSDQLKTYAAYLEEALGEPCDVGYMVLLKRVKFVKSCAQCGEGQEDWAPQAKKCKVHGTLLTRTPQTGTQLLIHSFSSDDLESTLSDYENIITAIESKIEFKNASQCMNYNKPCEFYDVCWKNKKPENIPHLVKKD